MRFDVHDFYTVSTLGLEMMEQANACLNTAMSTISVLERLQARA